MRRTMLRGALAAALILAAGPGLAQLWPSRPIKWIMPYQAGSSPDITVRIVAQAISAGVRGTCRLHCEHRGPTPGSMRLCE